jgi:hypothetical protein
MNKRVPLVVALYLPQYYETEYNNKWWEKGYTEWTALKRAKPLFSGHYQPRVPLNENYYDLSVRDNIKWQMDLAKEYGIDGFAIYQYYSCGSKLLEVPTEIIRDDPSLDLPFFLYWANESWKKAWFGQDNTVVWEQKYGTEKDWKEQFDYCLQYFMDERYIKVNGMPVYAIYNPWALSDGDRFIDLWNIWAKEAGFPGIYFIKNIGRRDHDLIGKYSAKITREPNYTFAHDEGIFEKIVRVGKSKTIDFLNKKFFLKRGKGIVQLKQSYDVIWEKILARKDQDEQTILGCFSDWDNSPRKSYNSIIMQGASPEKFKKYFSRLFMKALEIGSPMLAINAWNEWAEGAYLEPDEKYGFSYLEAIRSAKEECIK